MKPDRAVYNSRRLAAAYAHARPAVHPHVLAHVCRHLPFRARAARALDIGCGAGRSTAALEPLAERVVGIDPVTAMLEHRRVVAPHATFAAAECEALPFAPATFDLVTAAGSINYTDWSPALAEIARVLVPNGAFVLYDFAAGRRLRDDDRLAAWYADFERRYPEASGYTMDPRRLPFDTAGLGLYAYDEFDVAVPMTLESYLRYVLSETRVESARRIGTSEDEIREWCQSALEGIVNEAPRDVLFPAYAACVRKRTG